MNTYIKGHKPIMTVVILHSLLMSVTLLRQEDQFLDYNNGPACVSMPLWHYLVVTIQAYM